MKRDRVILWCFIALLALVIVAQIIGNGLMNHWRQNGFSKPNPMYERLGGKR